MRALVTGATGFLGSHLVEELVLRNWEVKALVRRGSDFLKNLKVETYAGDLEDFESLKNAAKDVDIVFHCAAKIFGKNFDEFYRVNVEGTKNLLEAISDVKRFVYVSTVSVYGDIDIVNGDENLPKKAKGYYGRTKALAEDLVFKYQDERGIEVSVIRPRFIYGERDKNLTPVLLSLARKRVPLINGGRNLNDSVYVKDVVDALILCATKPKAVGEVYNITDGRKTTVREIIHTVQEILGIKKTTASIPYTVAYMFALSQEFLVKTGIKEKSKFTCSHIKTFGKNRNFDISKARKELGYKPKFSLKKGFENVLKKGG